jgi:hypothetical protein
VAIAAAGCGGGSGDGGGASFAEGGTPHGTPTSAEVVGCLRTAGRKAGFTVSESAADLDPIARQAGDRAVAIDAGAGRKATVIFSRTEQEAGTIADRYRSAPIDERGSGSSQSGTIVTVDNGLGAPTSKPILDCTKYGTKEQGRRRRTRPPPPPVELDANQAKVYARSQVADADFGTVKLVRVQDPRRPREPFLPKAGSRFIGVTFEITGKARLGYRGFSLYGKGDRQYDQVPDPDAFSAGTIGKGETKRGLVIFEVPKSVKAAALRFHIDPPIGANDSVELELG